MDAFTENILTRARERQKLLQGFSGEERVAPLRENNKVAVSEPNLTEVQRLPPKEVRSETNIPSKLSPSKENFSQGSPGSQTKTLNIQRDNFNMEIKVKSADNVRLEVEIQEEDEHEENSDSGSHENGGLREESKNRLKRLGKLYAGGEEADISSPIHRTEAKFYQSIGNETEVENHSPKRNKRLQSGLTKLANLANTINQWEDDLSHPTLPTDRKPSTPKKTWKPPAPQPPVEKQAFSPQKPTPSRALKPKAPSPPNASRSSPKKSLFQREDTFTKEVNSPVKNVSSSPKKEPNEVKSGGYISPTKNLTNSPKKWAPSSPTKTLMESSAKRAFGSPTKAGSSDGAQCVGATPKKISWDKKVLDTLDQNNQPSEKQTKISRAEIELHNSIPEEIVNSSEIMGQNSDLSGTNSEKPNTQAGKSENAEVQTKIFRSGGIANRAAMFEQKANEAPIKPSKDPALLSLSERKALFEKNRGEALVPKVPFGMSVPVKVETVMKAPESKFIGASKSKENLYQANKNVFESNKAPEKAAKNVKSIQKDQNKAPTSKGKYPAPPVVEHKVAPPHSQKVTPKTKVNTPTVAIVHQSGGIASKMAALLENQSTISEEQITNKVKEERQKELDMLLNRFNKNKEIAGNQDAIEVVHSDEGEYQSDSEYDETDEETAMLKKKPATIVSQKPRKSAEKRKSGSRLSTEADSAHVVSVIEDVKRIKVSPPKAGRLYPNLSDIEATTTDQETRTPTPNQENSYEDNNYDSDDPNTSFGRDILQTVCKNIPPTRKVSYKDSSSGSENSSLSGELDEILEELEDDNSSIGPTPPKHGRKQSPKSKHTKPQQSNSFHYKSFTSTSSSSPSSQKFQSPKKSAISPRQSTDLPLVVDGDEVLTLTHTVSFYRKKQNEVHTPVRQIIRQPVIEETSDSDNNAQDDAVQEKINELQIEVNKQQNIISQTSQALNLCSSTPEFSGSTEQVEAERVLLVAMHRRQAALHELQRLKVEGTVRPLSQHSQNVPLEKGTLTISNIVLPLKQKYVTALAAAGGKGHHVVCLIKCGEQVLPTKLVSTVASNSKNPDVDLYVPGTVTLNNIYSDFTVTFEVYCLQAQEESLPHEVKYHINKKGLTTPKKNKQDSRLIRPPKESPAGPQAVRTSSFALMGYVVFSVQAVNKRVWSLNNTPPMSPLEGSVEMKISCELAVSVEHRGFLTMFEDVTGFGAWHRRWCLLKGQTLSYWKYPEDERKVPPVDSIDLKTCITKEVGPVSREICARLHTFLLERERPAYPSDKDTLVVVKKGDKTVIRHLLSADTKEERIEWCYKLNAALTAIRMWGTNQH